MARLDADSKTEQAIIQMLAFLISCIATYAFEFFKATPYLVSCHADNGYVSFILTGLTEIFDWHTVDCA